LELNRLLGSGLLLLVELVLLVKAVLVFVGDDLRNRLLEHRDLGTGRNLEDNLSRPHRHDGAEKAAAEHHPAARTDCAHRPLQGLLALALWPQDQKIERHHKQGDEDQGRVLLHCSGIRL
jgi:hypothetical protein